MVGMPEVAWDALALPFTFFPEDYSGNLKDNNSKNCMPGRIVAWPGKLFHNQPGQCDGFFY
jgi:hypothetical protein